MDGNTALGASSPAKPAFTRPEPLSHTRAVVSSSSHMVSSFCKDKVLSVVVCDGGLTQLHFGDSETPFSHPLPCTGPEDALPAQGALAMGSRLWTTLHPPTRRADPPHSLWHGTHTTACTSAILSAHNLICEGGIKACSPPACPVRGLRILSREGGYCPNYGKAACLDTHSIPKSKGTLPPVSRFREE